MSTPTDDNQPASGGPPAKATKAKPARRPAPPKASSGGQNRLVTLVVLTAFISTVLSAVGVIMFQRFVLTDPSAEVAVASAPANQAYSYYEFPKMTVYLKRTGARQVGLASIRVTAEFNDPEPLLPTKAAQPRIVDAMQTFLRERTRDELDGGQGTEVLRQAFLHIVNDAIVPHHANTVLFREILIQ